MVDFCVQVGDLSKNLRYLNLERGIQDSAQVETTLRGGIVVLGLEALF